MFLVLICIQIKMFLSVLFISKNDTFYKNQLIIIKIILPEI